MGNLNAKTRTVAEGLLEGSPGDAAPSPISGAYLAGLKTALNNPCLHHARASGREYLSQRDSSS